MVKGKSLASESNKGLVTPFDVREGLVVGNEHSWENEYRIRIHGECGIGAVDEWQTILPSLYLLRSQYNYPRHNVCMQVSSYLTKAANSIAIVCITAAFRKFHALHRRFVWIYSLGREGRLVVSASTWPFDLFD